MPMHATCCQKGCVTCKSKKDVIEEYVWLCHCDILYVGRTTQRLQERIKQYVPKPLRHTTTPTQVQGNPPIPTNQNTAKQKKCKAKSKTQFEPESNSAIGQHLLESNQCARNYSASRFKILTTARSQFHLSHWKQFIFHKKKKICAHKSSLYLPFNCFDKIRACCQ